MGAYSQVILDCQFQRSFYLKTFFLFSTENDTIIETPCIASTPIQQSLNYIIISLTRIYMAFKRVKVYFLKFFSLKFLNYEMFDK